MEKSTEKYVNEKVEEFEEEFCTVPDLDEDTGSIVNWKASSYTRATDVRNYFRTALQEGSASELGGKEV